MAIQRTTTNIGLSILERGTPGWGVLTNQNMDFIDQAFGLDRERITSLENETAALPLAIAAKVGHNLLNNNIFSRPAANDPSQATGWTAAFANGAVGYTTRDTSTYLIGRGGAQSATSQRISITNVNLANQIRPYPGLNVLDPITQQPIATNDARQLTNAFGYVFQSVILSSKTKYTLSCYGKPEIPTSNPPINVHWKIGIVFKNGSSILHSYFSDPQINYTSDINTGSFQRAELTFETPDLPVVQAEVWLVAAGNSPGSIGSCYFDGVQLEQATRATALETFAVRNGDLSIPGDLIVGGSLKLQQDQLVFEGSGVVFTGNVQIGDDVNQDILDVFTKIATFYGPVKILGDTIIGDSPTEDKLDITVNKTTFFNNQDTLAPQGGDVEIQGDLVVRGNTTLGNGISDTVTINASLITAFNDLNVDGDANIGGALTVARATSLGTNHPTDKLSINMSGLGTDIYGSVYMDDNLTVARSVTIGTPGSCLIPSPDTLVVQTGISTFHGTMIVGKGLTVGGTGAPCPGGPIQLYTDGHDFELTAQDINVFAGSGDTVWQSLSFDLSGSLDVGSSLAGQYFNANVENIVLGAGSLASSATLAINAISSSFSGNASINRNAAIAGGLNIGAAAYSSPTSAADAKDSIGYKGQFLFGSGLLNAGREFVSFKPNVIKLTSPFDGYAIGGEITFGDPNALQLEGTLPGGTTDYTIGAGSDIQVLASDDRGQIITNVEGDLQAITVDVSRFDPGTSTGTLQAKVYMVGPDGITPTGSPLVVSEAVAFSVSAGSFQSVTLPFTTSFSLSATTDYAIVWSGTNLGYPTGIRFSNSTSYSNGACIFYNTFPSPAWTASTLGNFVFTVATQLTTSVRRKYNTTVNVFAGKTNFGTTGLGAGQENIGDVEISGNLQVHGSTILGNDTTTDTVEIKAYHVLINSSSPGEGHTNATIRIGGGFQDVTWTPAEYMAGALANNRGGLSLNNNGDLWIDGKLTVKGPIDPIELIVTPLVDSAQTNAIVVKLGNTTDTFKVSKQGSIWAEGSLSLNDGDTAYISNTATTFARSAAPLTNFTVYATSTSLSGNLTVAGSFSVNQAQVTDIDILNDANINGDLVVEGTFTTYGAQTTIGNAAAGSRVDVLVDTLTFGVDGSNRGNVTIGNDLIVRHDVTLGSGGSDVATLSFDTIHVSVASDRVLLAPQQIVSGAKVLELKGFRVGGGYQNNVYNSSELDHGGVTIDPYGNIYADGSMFVNGELGFNRLTLTAPLGTDLCDPFLVATNKVLGDDVFMLDNLGNVEADGYYFIHDKYVTQTCNQPLSQTYPNSAPVMFRVIHDTTPTDNVVFEVDNSGNVILDGYLTTLVPGGSTLATTSVTVGTGTKSLGDFNQLGHRNASADPIGAALSYLSNLTTGRGKIVIKKGTYTVPPTGWAVPANVSIEGEGAETLLQASSGTIFTLYSNTSLCNLRTTGGTVGITVATNASNILASDITLSAATALQVQAGTSNINIRSVVASTTDGVTGLSLNGSAQIVNSSFTGYRLGASLLGSNTTLSECTIDGQGANITGIPVAASFAALGNGASSIVWCMAVFNNELYAGGSFGLVKWTGSSWVSAGTFNNIVQDLVVFSNELYIGGYFTNGGGVTGANRLVKWNGTSFSVVGSANLFNDYVRALAVYNGQLYIGGAFTNGGGVSGANYLVRWNGTAYSLVGSSSAFSSSVAALGVYSSQLYIGGGFTNGGGVSGANYVVSWNNTNYSRVGPSNALNNTVYSFASYNSELYIGGMFTNASSITGANRVVKWDNTTYSLVGASNAFANGIIYKLGVYSGELYIGGQYTSGGSVSGANNIVRWNGTSYSLVGPTNSLNNSVCSFCLFSGDWIVGGDFTDVGGTSTADRVVKFVPAYTAIATVTAASIEGANNRVINCNILSCDTGLVISSSATETQITDNTLVGSLTALYGMTLAGSSSTIRGNRIKEFASYGMQITGSQITVADNYFSRGGDGMGLGIDLLGSYNQIHDNFITNSGKGIAIAGSYHTIRANRIAGTLLNSPGLLVTGNSHLIESNTISGFTLRSIDVANGDLTRIVNNQISGSVTSIYAAANNLQIVGNQLSNYTTTGIALTGGGSIISHNRVPGGATTGIAITGAENVINNNYVVDHSTDGITVIGNDNIAVGNITLRNPT